MDAAELPAAVLVGLSSASGADGRLRVRASRARPRSCVRLPGGSDRRGRSIRPRSSSRRCSRTIDGWTRRTSTSGAATTTHTSRSSSARPFRNPIHETGRGWRRLGAGYGPGEPGGDEAGAADRRSRHIRTDVCVDPRPTLVIQGTDERLSHVTQGIGLAHDPSRPARAIEAAGTWSTPGTRSASTC